MDRPYSVQAEAEEIIARTGRYIPPYKLSCMMQTVSKVLKVITSENVVSTSYEDIGLVLEIVHHLLAYATGKEEE